MKIYKFIGFIALLGWSAVSCNDWLDVRPDTEQKEEDQFSTYKGFRVLSPDAIWLWLTKMCMVAV